MASSFINIKGIGFWANDYVVEAILLCLIDEIELSTFENENWLNAYKIELAFQALPLIYGGMELELERFITSKERVNCLNQLIDSIIIKIAQEQNYFHGFNLHSLRIRAMRILEESKKLEFKNEKEFIKVVEDSHWYDIDIHEDKAYYTNGFLLLKKLINGELKTTGASKKDYWDLGK